MHPSPSLTQRLRRIALPALLMALPLAAFSQDQRTFDTPEAAVAALAQALKSSDERGLVALVGDKHRNLVATGDAAGDAARRAQVASLLATFSMLDDSGPDRRVLLLGEQAWPLPIPLVRQANQWRFAAEQAADEILNRRIGANERNAIAVLKAYVQAQRDYASQDRNGDGVLQYAARLASTPGRFDGLYWRSDDSKGEEPSPFGPLVAQSAGSLQYSKVGDPYRGYRFRILTRQGPAAAGGAYSYMINGRLVAGFAMVAYPAVYGQTGLATFVVNHNGKVFEKDLGAATRTAGEQVSAFDPGRGWAAINGQ